MFRMASIFCRLMYYYLTTGHFPYEQIFRNWTYDWIKGFYIWNTWLLKFFILQFLYVMGIGVRMLYVTVLKPLDVHMTSGSNISAKVRKRIVRKNKRNILVLAGKYCVFSNVHNVYAQDLALLRLPGKDSKDSYANRAINWWNEMRMNNGVLPPPCWPTNVFFLIFMMLVMIYTIAKGYSRILQMKNYKKPNPLILKTSNDTIEDDRCHSFDSDLDMIIVDNAANCIVWKDKKLFVPGTYKLLKENESPVSDTAAGAGNAIAIGDLSISWKDDNSQIHQFILKNTFHIPDSPVNILGISAFSKCIGDYEEKGTRINSSGQDSIFTWDNGKYTRTFSHCNSHMPTLPVNEGYSRYHKFCNFVDTICPIRNKCFHVNNKIKYKDQILYDVGEEVLYHNAGHVETGIVENIKPKKYVHTPEYQIKFKDNRSVNTSADHIKTKDENDLASIPIKPEEFL